MSSLRYLISYREAGSQGSYNKIYLPIWNAARMLRNPKMEARHDGDALLDPKSFKLYDLKQEHLNDLYNACEVIEKENDKK